MALPPPPAPGGADPMAALAGGAPAPAAPTDQDQGQQGQVVVTIARLDDGSYVVYPGDEPDEGDMAMGGPGESDEDIDAGDEDEPPGGGAGAAGGPPGGGSDGEPAGSIGEALKFAMDFLRQDAASNPAAGGGGGSAQDQFAAGFSDNAGPTPAAGRRGRGAGM